MAVYEWLLWVMAVFLAREMKYNIIKQRYAEQYVNLSVFLMFMGFIFFYNVYFILWDQTVKYLLLAKTSFLLFCL